MTRRWQDPKRFRGSALCTISQAASADTRSHAADRVSGQRLLCRRAGAIARVSLVLAGRSAVIGNLPRADDPFRRHGSVGPIGRVSRIDGIDPATRLGLRLCEQLRREGASRNLGTATALPHMACLHEIVPKCSHLTRVECTHLPPTGRTSGRRGYQRFRGNAPHIEGQGHVKQTSRWSRRAGRRVAAGW